MTLDHSGWSLRRESASGKIDGRSARFSLIGIYVSALSPSHFRPYFPSRPFIPFRTDNYVAATLLSHTLKMSPVSWQYLPRLRHMFPWRENGVGRQFEFCIKHQCVYSACLDRAISSLLDIAARFSALQHRKPFLKKKKGKSGARKK